jgi:hypothetical protein
VFFFTSQEKGERGVANQYKEWVIIDWTRSGDQSKASRFEAVKRDSLTPEELRTLVIVGTADDFLDATSKAVTLEAETMRRNNPRTILRTVKSNPKKKKTYRRTPKKKRWAKVVPGELAGWKKSKTQKARLAALEKLIKKDGYTTVIRRLNQMANLSWDLGTVKKMRSDIMKLGMKHRPDAWTAEKKRQFKAKTEEMLKKKKSRKALKEKSTKKKKKKATKKKAKRRNPRASGSKMRLSIPESAFRTQKSLEDAIYKRAKRLNPAATRDWARSNAKKLMKQKKK